MNVPLTRESFALNPKLVYLNHAAIGVLPVRAAQALQAFVQAHSTDGVLGIVPYEMQLAENRAKLARFIGAADDELAFLSNTSEAVNILARGLCLGPGDEIITNDNEFGSNALPWLALRENGVHVQLLETARERMTPDHLARAITERTKVVAVSWVSFIDGYRHDLAALAEIAHRKGAILAVDVIQGLGAFPFSMHAMEVDAAYGGAQKWLLAEPGLGYLCVKGTLLERLAVKMPGWRSLHDMWNFLDYEQPYCAGAARFEAGTPNLMGIAALMASLELLGEAGLSSISAHILALNGYLRQQLCKREAHILSLEGNNCESGILTFSLREEDPLETGRRLAAAGIVTTNRTTGIRVSPHGYSTFAEIDALLEALDG